MLKVKMPKPFCALWKPYRYKVFYGGRGGGKSWQFAIALIIMARDGQERILCAREVQNSIRDSVKRLLDDVIARLGLENEFISTDTEIRHRVTGSVFLFSGLRVSPERLKSFEGVTRAWVEEAETVTERSLDLLIPTIRASGSEIWFSFNPDRVQSPVYQRFVVNTPPPKSYVRKVNYNENPWFPEVLREEMEYCKKTDPDKYDHVWLGNPVVVAKGSYYAKLLQTAKDEQRIAKVIYEPTLMVNTAWDLGVSDSTSIWFFQVSPAGEYRIIDHYSTSGEGLGHYVEVLRSKPYSYGQHIAPHDIAVRELGSGKSRLETAAGMGINFEICPNIGIADGIHAARSILPKCWFDAEKCKYGLESLWSYQREWDERKMEFKDRPLHDWTSHDADAFRYLAVGYQQQVQRLDRKRKRRIA